MKRLRKARWPIGFALWGLAGCTGNNLTDGLPPDVGCSTCHGDEASPAPPLSLSEGTETTEVGVGAHRVHLAGGLVGQAVACTECHRVPSVLDEEGHVDPLPADITWGALAASGGLLPSWDHDTATCSNVYCHGATLAGGLHTRPVWTRVDGSQKGCDSCHGSPPPDPHPQETACRLCHAETVRENGSIDLAGGHHMDGVLDAPASACSACHGSADSPAPPPSTSGATDTAVTEVGAHQLHLSDGFIRQAIACEECHLVPARVSDPGHLDASPAEVVWGALATTGGLIPGWDRDGNRCSSVYCHGATLPGGRDTEPTWTIQGDPQSRCGLCHGVPPPSPHTVMTDCSRCHPDTVDPTGQIDVAGGFHINGTLDFLSMACNDCHGDADSPAPPVDTQGNTSTAERGVGAHRQHLGPSVWHAEIACVECHAVPAGINTAGHIDSLLPAELTWGPLARRDGANPDYGFASGTCSGVYCHGETLQGTGLNRQPDWTSVGTGEAACGSCHALPPDGPTHPQQSDCSSCHECVVEDDNQTIRSDTAYLHINGRVNHQFLGNCPSP